MIKLTCSNTIRLDNLNLSKIGLYIRVENLLNRWTGSQISLGEQNALPTRLLLLLSLPEEHPELVVGDQRPPRLAHHAKPRRFLGPHQPQYLHQQLRRNRIELPQRRRIRRRRGRRIRGRVLAAGDYRLQELSDQRGHGRVVF